MGHVRHNERLFFRINLPRSVFADGVQAYSTERPLPSLGYVTPVNFAVEAEKQQAGSNLPGPLHGLNRGSANRLTAVE